MLARIAVEEKDSDVREAAVAKVTDQALLATIAMEASLQVIDIADLTDPACVGGCDTNRWAWDVAVSGSYAGLHPLATGERRGMGSSLPARS